MLAVNPVGPQTEATARSLHEAEVVARYGSLNPQHDQDLRSLSEVYQPPDNGFWCVTFDGAILATIGLRRLSLQDSAEIKRLLVRPSVRGRGLGEFCIRLAIHYAIYRGYRYLYLDCTRDRAAALGLYQKCGFRPTEKYNDNIRADIYLRKDL